MPKLTPKQQAFVDAYIELQNGAAAARKAGYKAKPDVIAAQNLRKLSIQEAISEATRERNERCKVDQDFVLTSLVDAYKLDILDIMDEDAGSFKPLSEWPKAWRINVSGIEVNELYEYNDGKREHIGFVKKIKFVDKARILEMIGKHTGVRAWDKDLNVVADGIEMIFHYHGKTEDSIPG